MDRCHRNSQQEQSTIKQHPKERRKLIKISDPVGQGDRPHKDQSQDVVGANIGVYSPDIQPKPRRNYRQRNRVVGPTHGVPHKRRRYLGIGPKSQTRCHERSMGSRIKRCHITRTIDIIQEIFSLSEKCIPH